MVDNDTHELDYFLAGAVGGVDASTSGTFYIDSFETDQTIVWLGSLRKQTPKHKAQPLHCTVNKLSGETIVYIGSYYEFNYHHRHGEDPTTQDFAIRDHDIYDGDRDPKSGILD